MRILRPNPPPLVFDLVLLALLATFAGFIDAIVGGGGLIQLPALFSVYPEAPPARLFGTNKLAAIAGTAVAASRYLRRVRLPWRTLLPTMFTALIGSGLGANVVSWLPREAVRPVMLLLLVVVAIYTFRRKRFGAEHAPRWRPAAEAWLGGATGAVLGFYDGFFGPGTGAFLLFVFVRAFGWDLLVASTAAKVVNVATNTSALLYFGATGNVMWRVGLLMAACNIAGALLGTRLALSRGTGFVRQVFLIVLLLLIARFSWDTVAGWR